MGKPEIDRTHNQHYVYREIWSDDFSAPVIDLLTGGVNVLDVGCGPGTWILELGTKYQNSNFKGIDVFPLYPSTIKPQNVSFELHNILNGLPFEDNKFEYVIMRFMMFALSLKEWESVINEMVRVCKPDGWIEIMEDDLVLHNMRPRTGLLMKIITDELKRKGVETVITPYILDFLNANTELSNIVNRKKFIKLGKGDKKGELHLESLKWGAKSLFESKHLFENGVATYDELIEDFVQECNEDKEQ
ncbi:S-adenosyl-L-methionine-dependent methyltransferase [Rhizophagus clarus]|uniref:S-adenosyl-L-methionine-dependent methyltransferase n=1 Tax=Rhizophagus clarus TaxID=94130 RepID=A0A8H3QBE9_9GLOM|nr:S-adenosyl-L-methionine-dependent methyltransferase [Rhizophagus clarus]